MFNCCWDLLLILLLLSLILLQREMVVTLVGVKFYGFSLSISLSPSLHLHIDRTSLHHRPGETGADCRITSVTPPWLLLSGECSTETSSSSMYVSLVSASPIINTIEVEPPELPWCAPPPLLCCRWWLLGDTGADRGIPYGVRKSCVPPRCGRLFR